MRIGGKATEGRRHVAPENSIVGGYVIQLILVISGLLPRLGRKGEMLHRTVKHRLANLRDLNAINEREGANCHYQDKFDEAPETFKKSVLALRAFLMPLPDLDFGDSLLSLLVHITGGKLCPGIQTRNSNRQSSGIM
jgi:hypothetical protein